MIDLSRLFKSSTERLRAFDIETQMFHATVAGPHISIAVRDTCVHVVTYSKAECLRYRGLDGSRHCCGAACKHCCPRYMRTCRCLQQGCGVLWRE